MKGLHIPSLVKFSFVLLTLLIIFSMNFFTRNKFKNKILLIFGPPGSGKGTFSKILGREFSIPIYSTGDHLRNILKNPAQNEEILEKLRQVSDKDSIEQVKEYIESSLSNGKFLPDDFINVLVKHRLMEIEDSDMNSIILDGYPRNLFQAEKFERNFSRKIDVVINLIQDRDIIIQKVLGRRVCEECNSNYNVVDVHERGYHIPSILPKEENTCDYCGGRLIQRADDRFDIIRARLEDYSVKSHDVLEFFKGKGVVLDFEIKRGLADMASLIEKLNGVF